MFLFLLLVFVIGFGVGALTIVGAEAVGVYFIIEWLNQKTKQKEAQIASRSQESSRDLDHSQSLDFALNKQGVVWLLESEKIPKNWLDKGPKEQKRKNDFLEVFPVKKHAKIKDQKLILAESDGSNTVIELKGCMIEAVSATSLSSRKWAKRFPLKLESKTSMINNGSKILYIYLETSWEKESWCKALRLASCDKKERVDWFFKLHEGFHNYLTTLNPGYPSFMKPSMGLCAEPADQTNRSDGTSSKVRFLWKKIAKKTSRVGLENRSSWAQLSGLAERKPTEKTRIFQELVSASASMKRSKSEENLVQQSPSTLSHSGSQSHSSGISDVDSDDRLGNDEGTLFFSKKNDEGTLCWNLFISRLFFDVKSNAEIKRSIQAWVQRTLSSTRTPSYIGELICTAIDLGNLPPYIHGVRIVPMDMNEVWAFEVDIEYSGGVVLDIETRLEVRELDFQKGIVDSDPGSSPVGEISSDLLEGFEYFGRQLNSTGGIADAPESKEKDGLKSCKNTTSASTSGSRWKSILNSVVKQVSQVPLSLAIRVASLRGTLRLHIKPPPSDQLWFAFTSMPDIGFNLEPSIGEHKISSGRVASFLISWFKASILETLVLPNSESVCIPWMIADKDDWVPKEVAPFIWLQQEVINEPTAGREVTTSQPTVAKPKTESSSGTSSYPECNPINESTDVTAADSTSSNNLSRPGSRDLQELTTPLLGNDEPKETPKQVEEAPEYLSLSGSVSFGTQDSTTEEDDSRPKRMGRRARMLDLGKKMGEKFEEKRRNIEEKSRNIVEKMRGP